MQRFSQSPPPKEIHQRINVKKFHGLLQTKLPLPPASSSEIDERTFEKWVQELTLAITESANKSTYLTHTKRFPYWDKQLDTIKKNLCRAKNRRDQLQTRKLKSRLRPNKRRHEAKIASQVTPINAFSSIYQTAPKARPTRKKTPEAQARTLDPARTATKLYTKFAAIQSFPKHLPKHPFPEIFQDPESEIDFLQEIHTRLTPATVQAAIYKPAPSSSPGLDLISPGLLRLTWSCPSDS